MATQEQLQAIRNYAQSLSGDERKSFIEKFNAIKADDSKVATLSQRIGGVSPSKKSNIGESIALTAGGIGGAAAIGYGLDRLYGKPFRAIKTADKELRNIANKYGIDPQTSPGFVPKGLNDKMQSLKVTNQADIKNLKTTSDFKIKDISRQISTLDSDAIIKESSSLADIIKTNIPDTYKKVTDNFGKRLDLIDELASSSGFQLTTRKFSSNFLNDIIEDSIKSGISRQELSQLIDVKDSMVDLAESQMPLSQAKSVISNLTRENPYSPLSAKIREAWSGFLEKEAPKEIRPLYEKLNSQYKPFTEARSFLTKLSDPRTGEFDTGRLSKYISDYAKKGSDDGISKLMKFVGEGNELMPGVEGVSDKFGNISNLGKARKSLTAILKKVQSEKGVKINATDQNNIAKVKQLLADRSRANVLVDIAKENRARLTARNPLNWPGKFVSGAFGVGKGIIRGLPLNMLENEIQKKSLGVDPTSAFEIWRKSQFGNQKEKEMMLQDLERRAKEALSI